MAVSDLLINCLTYIWVDRRSDGSHTLREYCRAEYMGDLSALVREERLRGDALRTAYHDLDDPNDDPKRYQSER